MKIRNFVYVFILGIGILAGCSDERDPTPPEELLNGTWHLKNLRGGFAGIDENYPDGNITWTFNAQSQHLMIVNNNQASTSYIFDSGTYTYAVVEINNQNYLQVANEEYGGITVSANSLIVDQNRNSNGAGADGFILSFKK